MLSLPARLIAGDTLDLSVSGELYPASAGWSLHVRLIPRAAAAAAISLMATAVGDAYRLLVAATTTAAWAAGAYSWQAWVVRAGTVITVNSGQVEVLPDPRLAAAGLDTRTQAERALADARTALASWTPTTRRWQIGDREQEFGSAADVLAVVEYWSDQVRDERRAAALASGQRLPPRRTTLRIGR